MNYKIEFYPVGLYQCNCILIYNHENAIVVDPGGDPQKILTWIDNKKLVIKYILITHAHIDHIAAIQPLKNKFQDAIVMMHENDLFLYQNVEMQADFLGWPDQVILPDIDVKIKKSQTITPLDLLIEIWHTPGHTPGSVCFGLDLDHKCYVLSGDTLFKGSIGRTDLWGGNYEQILDSIHQYLLQLNPETQVIPGHGPVTTIEHEKKRNPFLI